MAWLGWAVMTGIGIAVIGLGWSCFPVSRGKLGFLTPKIIVIGGLSVAALAMLVIVANEML